MCSDPNSRPPAPPGDATAAEGRRIDLVAADGSNLAAYRADASEPIGAGIIVLPDYYGLTPFYEALALRFAEIGVDAIAIDYYGRTAAPPPRPSSFDHVAHSARTTWAGLQADAQIAAETLRSEREVDSVFSIGFCFGGRTSFLLATLPQLGMSGVIGFYGWPVGAFANDTPAPATVAPRLGAPLLGVFGGADPKVTPAHVAAFENALAEAPIEHRLISYPGAPHSFFDRAQGQHGEASDAAWGEVRAFIDAQRGGRE